ncbi:MAG: hypothetical protein WC655_24345 [Candidatus Hydrogenedentales bacterium]
MPTLYVREIPDSLYKLARETAAAQGRSLSSYVVTVLEQAMEDEQKRRARSEALTSIRRRRRRLPEDAPDSVTIIRQIRDENE